MIDLLYPDGAGCSLADYLAEHQADADDVAAVELFADPDCELTIAGIREAVERLDAEEDFCSEWVG